MPEDQGSQTTVMTRRYTNKAKVSNAGDAGAVNKFTAKKFSAHLLEMEDVNFHFDSAVLLPDFGTSAPQPGTPEQNRITGLGVLYACYKHAKDNPEQKLLILGHTDRSGPSDYNVVLSQLRADNVLHALLGNREEWIDICQKKYKVEDYQQILKWVDINWKWGCDPGPINNQQNPQTREATRTFQKRYNIEFQKERAALKAKNPATPMTIGEDGSVGRETWGAFFDVYMRELTLVMGTDYAGLQKARDAIKFLADEPQASSTDPDILDEKPQVSGSQVKKRRAVGCGENFPITPDRKENYRNPIDRRVEFLFFDPGEEPNLTCLLPNGPCAGKKCELRNKNIYVFKPVPVEPLPERSGIRIIVSLRLFYKDPELNDRNFPEGFPVVVKFTKGDPQNEKVGKDGMLIFGALREKEAFTLQFKFGAVHYMVSPPRSAAAGQPEQLATKDKIRDLCKQGHRVFSLPLDWELANSDWNVEGASTYKDYYFRDLQNINGNIGSDAAPVKMELKPHWQYLKYLYFDRFLKKKLSIPSIMIEGFRKASSASGNPDTQSNWTTDPEMCQCLPWIIRKNADGTDAPKPDKDILIQFRTASDTYIDSSGSSPRLVTKGSGSSGSSDPGLNLGDSTSMNFSLPSGERLKFYDLPAVWKSRTYFARLSGGSGAPAAKEDVFEKLAAENTTDGTPLLFSLDDMVLYFGSPSGSLTKPLEWNPASDRLAIFCNTFSQKYATGVADTTNLSVSGVYKPDTGNKESFFSQKVQMTTTRSDKIAYIADYPDWPRLVMAKGNFYDAFDKRTPDGSSGVVGARAAVCYINVFASSKTSVQPGNTRPAPPSRTSTPFFIIQPLHEQRHDAWNTPSDSDHYGIGRFDLALLRCCNIESDGVTEGAVCLSYFRFCFNFNATFKPAFDNDGIPYGLTGSAARKWVDDAISALLKRWNGPDGSYNSGPAQLLPGSASRKLQVQVAWFAQALEKNISHYEICVFKKPDPSKDVRAYMSPTGVGVLDKSDNVPSSWGSFTFAHETGHGGSLGDDYIESTPPSSIPPPWLLGFDSNSPGAPFYVDKEAMMKGNRTVRARYFWHLAEWLRFLEGNADFKVKHDTYTYDLIHHPQTPQRSYVNWPLKMERNKTRGDHGRFDIFFYPLGKDAYSAAVLPAKTGKVGQTFDSIITVIVKMRIKPHISDENKLHKWLHTIDQRISLKYNYKYIFHGTVDGKSYGLCLLHFSPRYWVNNYSSKDPEIKSEHIEVRTISSGDSHWDEGVFDFLTNDHLLHFSVSSFDPPNSGEVSDFVRFFGHMVGLTDGNMSNASNYTPIARLVMSDANPK